MHALIVDTHPGHRLALNPWGWQNVVMAVLMSAALSACDRSAQSETAVPASFPGYVEADYIRLAPALAGTLLRVEAQRGHEVEAGALAFVLEQDNEQAARAEIQARIGRAEAIISNLGKGLRPDELASLRARLAQTEAALALSNAEFARQQQLVTARFVSPSRLDEARAAVRRDRARVDELLASLRMAEQGARPDEIHAARQELQAALAQRDQADWKINQKSQRYPVAARIVDILYRPGEWVPAGSPVITLLTPQNIKARFFVPQGALGGLQPGHAVTLQCDGCGAPIAARISHIAREAEYTTPIIYSNAARASLVFMIEAQASPADSMRLHPGQPLTVSLAANRPPATP